MNVTMGLCATACLLLATGQSQVIESPELRDARHHFYSARYVEAAHVAAPLTQTGDEALAAFELRTSALHFELKRRLGDATNKSKAMKQCAECQSLLDEFTKDINAGKALARSILKNDPQNVTVQFYLGKLDLNYVWMQLSTLGKRTGWSEYWNARHTMDAVLRAAPTNIRARVARAWIEYIVDTRVPWGLQWTLGGGDRKKALKSMIAAAAEPNVAVYDKAEAEFALWEMLVREKRLSEATDVAKRLSQQFPDNQDLHKFLSKQP
jgi:hypothetical protein